MSKRLIGVTLLLALLFGALGPVGFASATEEGESEGVIERQPLPPITEIGSQSDIAKEFLPEQYEEPSWFQWALYPLLIVGVIATFVVLFMYLVWQPKFADEQKTKRRR